MLNTSPPPAITKAWAGRASVRNVMPANRKIPEEASRRPHSGALKVLFGSAPVVSHFPEAEYRHSFILLGHGFLVLCVPASLPEHWEE